MFSPILSSSPRVLALAGSPTPGARSTALLRAAADLLLPGRAPAALVELRELPAEALLAADIHHPAIDRALQRLAQAEVLLVATPIYQAAYSGLLKVFLDLLPQQALRGKTVLPLATGGSTAHLLALDYTLQPVLRSLGARHLLDAVYATDEQFETDARGQRQPLPEVQQRLQRALAPLAAVAAHERVPHGLHRPVAVDRMPCRA